MAVRNSQDSKMPIPTLPAKASQPSWHGNDVIQIEPGMGLGLDMFRGLETVFHCAAVAMCTFPVLAAAIVVGIVGKSLLHGVFAGGLTLGVIGVITYIGLSLPAK